ncbi:MAG: YidC/Oxa1 family insertase periplasmic-domain containing protein [Fuerstiella sp.]
MDYRRFVTFLVVCFAFSYLYSNFVRPPQPPAVADADVKSAEPGGAEVEPTVDPVNESGEAVLEDGTPEEGGDAKSVASVVPEFPEQMVSLGSNNPNDNFALKAILSSKGASIQSVTLTDPKFKELKDTEQQVQVIGNGNGEGRDQTMALAIDVIDKQLADSGTTLETVNWELVSKSVREVVFGFEIPESGLAVRKKFSLKPLDMESGESPKVAYNTQPQSYTIETQIELINKSADKKTLQYELQGPVGIVLENAAHARKYRDIKLEFYGDDDAVTLSATALNDLYTETLEEKGLIPEQQLRTALKQSQAWTGLCRYAGVDVQFFAALVSTLDDRTIEERQRDRWIERIYPVMIASDKDNVNYGDLSFRLVSAPVTLEGDGATVSHRFAMFVGPKRRALLEPEPFVADQVLDYGWWFGFIARVMHSILDTFHSFGMPYFLAIISLTVLVRGMMFPISRKQAIMAAKQKALAPKLNELKLKHGDDKEKMARAQMELWRKHGINPLGGCLPIFIQFPVFIALYTCLNTAVDLRLAQFLWVENLAAPDALFTMPSLPFLGSDFNLLPCITVVLFLIQQKLFMPPPADEQAEMTQKMMNFMTIGMGLMFWHVPAGLCIYFIASSLWGIAERKLLKVNVTAPPEPSVTVKAPGDDSAEGVAPKKMGFVARKMAEMKDKMEELQKQAEQAQKASGNSRSTGNSSGKGKAGKKKKKR